MEDVLARSLANISRWLEVLDTDSTAVLILLMFSRRKLLA